MQLEHTLQQEVDHALHAVLDTSVQLVQVFAPFEVVERIVMQPMRTVSPAQQVTMLLQGLVAAPIEHQATGAQLELHLVPFVQLGVTVLQIGNIVLNDLL